MITMIKQTKRKYIKKEIKIFPFLRWKINEEQMWKKLKRNDLVKFNFFFFSPKDRWFIVWTNPKEKEKSLPKYSNRNEILPYSLLGDFLSFSPESEIFVGKFSDLPFWFFAFFFFFLSKCNEEFLQCENKKKIRLDLNNNKLKNNSAE